MKRAGARHILPCRQLDCDIATLVSRRRKICWRARRWRFLQSDDFFLQRRDLVPQAGNLGLQFLHGRDAVLQRGNLRFQFLQCCYVVLQASDLALQCRMIFRRRLACPATALGAAIGNLSAVVIEPQKSVVDAGEREIGLAERPADCPAPEREFHRAARVLLGSGAGGDAAFWPSTSMTVCAGAGAAKQTKLMAKSKHRDAHDVFLEFNAAFA